MDLLSLHIKSGLGVSFKADNGKYLSVVRRSGGKRNIEAVNDNKDYWTKFTIVKVDDDHVYLKAADGKYLSRIYRRGVNNIEAAKSYPDVFCKFRVFEADGKVVFKADNGRFLSRRRRRGGRENIEAAKGGLDKHTKFIVETGSTIPVREEIESISWGTYTGPTDININPKVVKTFTTRNTGSRDAVKQFTFDESIETSQETSWEHSWGVSLGVSYTFTAGVNIGVASASSSLSYSAEVRYDGKKGGNSGKTKTLSLQDQTTVTIPPKKRVVVSYVVKIDNAEIPFTATIKRTSEVGVTRIKEKGTWKGVIVFDSYIDIVERPIKK